MLKLNEKPPHDISHMRINSRMPRESIRKQQLTDFPFKEHFASIRRYEGLVPYTKRYRVTTGGEVASECSVPHAYSRRNLLNSLQLEGNHAEDVTDVVRTLRVHRPSAEAEELLRSILVLTAQYSDCVEARKPQIGMGVK